MAIVCHSLEARVGRGFAGVQCPAHVELVATVALTAALAG